MTCPLTGQGCHQSLRVPPLHTPAFSTARAFVASFSERYDGVHAARRGVTRIESAFVPITRRWCTSGTLPDVHTVFEVPRLPSSQLVPSGCVLATSQPVAGSHPFTVQSLPSLQSRAAPVRAPAAHASPDVQTEPSSQAVPSGRFDQLVFEVVAVHTSQAFALFTVPSPKHAPSITQKPVFTTNEHVPSPTQLSVVQLRPSSQV